MNGGYSGTSKVMTPYKLSGSGLPIELKGYWQSLRKCSKCGRHMWENGKETHCIGEFEEITEKKEKKAMPKTLKERVMEIYKTEFPNLKSTSLEFAADIIAARVGGTSSTVVQSIIREDTGKKYVRKDHNLKYAKEEIPALKINYTAEELQIIVDMYKAGSSDEQIGKEIHRSTGAVSVKLSALRKKGLIKCRTCHNKPIDNVSKKTEKVDIEVESKKFMEDLEPPHIAQETVKEPDETTNEEIGSTKVILIPAKPTLGQFIDFAAECGYGLESAGINGAGRMEINFMEG